MMPTSLKVMIKDALRGARFVLRRSSGLARPDSVPAPIDLLRLGDRVASRAEDTVIRLSRGASSPKAEVEAALRSYVALAAGHAGDGFEDRFRAAHYTLAKHAFALRGVDNAYVVELAFTEAARTLLRAGLPVAELPGFYAAAALAVITAAPVRLIDPVGPAADDPFVRSANAAVAVAVALAGAAYGARQGSVGATDCLASATEMIGPLSERIAAILKSDDPAAGLAALLDTYAPFIP